MWEMPTDRELLATLPEKFRNSTAYQVIIPPGTPSQIGVELAAESVTTWKTPTVMVNRVLVPEMPHLVPLNSVFAVHMTQDVDPQQIAKLISFASSGEFISFEFFFLH
jgi:hypothetical protein